MKARVKLTGEIVDVEIKHFGRYSTYVDEKGVMYKRLDDLDFDISENHTGNATNDPDYWTRLEHTYAGMAMQALLSSDTMLEVLSRRNNGTMKEEVAREAFDYAHALVEKLKEKEKK